MKFTVNFTYTVNEKKYSESVEIELENNTLTFSQLAKKLQEKSTYLYTMAVAGITQGETTWARENSKDIKITLQEKAPINVTLAPADSTTLLPNEILLELLKKTDAKAFTATTQLSAKQFAKKTQLIYTQLAVKNVDIFNQPSPSWKLLSPEQHQALIKLLANQNHMDRLLSFINTWLQSNVGAQYFYTWINNFNEKFIKFYEELPKPSAQHDALFALITREVGKKPVLNKITATADAIATTYPIVAASLRDTVTLLNWINDNKFPKTWHTEGVFYRNFQGVNFPHSADLSNTDLSDTNLSRTKLSGAKLSRANFSRADLSCADLSCTDLSGANFSCAELFGVKLTCANLSGAELFGVKLSSAELFGVNLYCAKLSGANLSHVDFSHADLSGADLSGANLSGAYFTDTILFDAIFSGTNLSDAYLSGAKLFGVILSGANLTGANLTGANLSGANLSGANLDGAKLSDAKLLDANLQGCVFSKNTNLFDTNFANANIDNAKGLDQIDSKSLASANAATLTALKEEIISTDNFTKLLTIYLTNNKGILFIPNKPLMGEIRSWLAPIPTTSGNELLETIKKRVKKILQSTKELPNEEQACLDKINDLIKLPPYLQEDVVKLTTGLHKP